MSGPGLRQVSLLRVPAAEAAAEPAAPEEEEDEEDAFKVHLIPRSSPTPRKKTPCSEEAEEPSLTRKVSFADTCGLSLVQVKYYEEFAFPEIPDPIDLGVQESDQPTFYVFPAFILPATQPQLLHRVEVEKVEVESIEPLEGDPLSVQGVIRVLNLSFQKSVYIRATLNSWTSYFDHPAEYVEGSSDGHTDRFSFRLSFVAPYVCDGARIEFVVRYETPAAVYWANNGGSNYSLVCKVKEQAVPTPKAFRAVAVERKQLKSCLKPVTWRYSEEEEEDMEEPDWERHDWTNDADVSASSTGPNDWIVQVPRVQVIKLSTPASLEGLTSTLAEQTQEVLENHIRQNKFIPIEEAHEARLQDNSMERDITPESKSYLGRSADTFQQQEPATISSLGSRVEEGGGSIAPDLLEAREENNRHVVQQSTKVQETIEAKGMCLTEEVSLPTESQLAKAMESPFQLEALPASEGDSRVGVDSAQIAEESSGKGTIRTSLQEVRERDAGIDSWVANLNHQNEANHEMLGVVGQEETAVQQPSPPVGVVAPGLFKWEESARLYIAPSLHAVGTYHDESGVEVGHDLLPPPETDSRLSATPWGIASTKEPSLMAGEEQEFPQERVMGSESWLDPAVLLDEMSTTQRLSINPNTPPPEKETVEVSLNPALKERGQQGLRELRAPNVKNGIVASTSCTGNEDSRTGKRPDSVEATVINNQQFVGVGAQDKIREAALARAAPLPPPSAGWAEGDMRGTCTDMTGPVTLAEKPLAVIRPRDELDLESLAVLKEVVILASKFMQLLVFLFVAVNDSSSLLWCTLYLISVFLL